MPKLRAYRCDCGTEFEFLFMTSDDVALCTSCGKQAGDKDELLGGKSNVITVPMYPGAKKIKAGYVHQHGDRPAEKGSVSVPTKVT